MKLMPIEKMNFPRLVKRPYINWTSSKGSEKLQSGGHPQRLLRPD
jgi:hypothetical protein